ncbi:hypothetical protein N0V90_002187 [Kalmusia sp. IMI 367209]|nr:hypothetical protein N0V90_002187 [Kalmusia sp. IMI 367209]
MAYAIMGNMPDSRMLTYRNLKDVRAVYFDGASANLMGDGTWSQMVFLYNGTRHVPGRGGMRPPGKGPPGHRPPGWRHKDSAGEVDEDEDEPPRRPPDGKPPGHWNPLADEYFRARELCKWLISSGLGGKGWGYEAIVRMNAGFELIWCDFDSPSLKLVSNLNVSAPYISEAMPALHGGLQQPWLQKPLLVGAQARLGVNEDEGPHGPGMSDPREPFRNTSNWFWFSAASKRYTGDPRMTLDPSGIFSFYEAGLQNQSRVRMAGDIERLNLGPDGRWKSKYISASSARDTELLKLQRRRREHRLTSVDKGDGKYMRDAVEKRLKDSLHMSKDGSKIDWAYVAKNIVTRYNNELKTLLSYLSDMPEMDETLTSLQIWLAKVRHLTHWFLLPFMEYPSTRPYKKDDLYDLFGTHSPLALSTLERCISQYDTGDEPSNEEDANFGQAIKETLHGLCSTVIKIGLHIEYHWFMYFEDKDAPVEEVLYYVIRKRAQRWKEDLHELIAWLAWVEEDVGCEEKCGIGERCYVPMWPVSGWDRRGWWGQESRYLWEGVCIGMERYPPEQWDTTSCS